jgi:hypothetical protein
MNIFIKNKTGSTNIFRGIELQNDEVFLIPSGLVQSWGNDVVIVGHVVSGSLTVSSNGSSFLNPIEGLKILQGFLVETKTIESPAFSAKVIGGKKIFSRITGKKFPVIVGLNTLDFSIPKNEMKMNGVEITNGKEGETVNFKVLDTPTGTISTVPNYTLNQFAFDLNLPNGFYSQRSNYDADVIKDLVIRIEINAVEARDLCVNYLLHEMKL